MNKVEKTFWATRNFKNIDKSYQDQPKLLEETLDAKPRMASPPLATYTAPSPQFELDDSDEKHQRVLKESMSKIRKHPKSSTSNVSHQFNFNLTIL